MEKLKKFYSKYRGFAKNLLFLATLALIGLIASPFLEGKLAEIWADKDNSGLKLDNIPQILISQENSLMTLSNPNNPDPKVVSKINVVITGYSSTVWQTDDTPFITASGSYVRDGIIANNYLKFGTKVKIPTLFGDKIFVVEDRMNWQKGNYHFDIWFPDYWQALNFGVKSTYIEVLES